jgi:hypothetical protein
MDKFSTISNEINTIVSEWEPKLSSLSQEVITLFKNSQNRTIKQIVGDMVDSASNNTHRVVHLQYQPSPVVFPNYATSGNNDRWIAIQNYQEENWADLVQLWKFSMLHFCHVIKNVDDSKLENEWIAAPDRKISLEAIIFDFLPHLKLHLAEIDALINAG